MTSYIHEMSRKQNNVPKVLEFSWQKSENLAKPRSVLKHQRVKHLLEMTRNVYPDLVKVFYTNLTLEGKNLVSYVKGVQLKITNEVWNNVVGIRYSEIKVGKATLLGSKNLTKYSFIGAV